MKWIILLFFSWFLIACGNNSETEIAEDKKNKDTSSIEIKEFLKENDSNALALQYPNFKILYELNGGKGTLIVDSLVSDTLILTTYKTLSKNPRPNDKPYVWFEVFHFKNDSLANEYYNKLKTIEMISDFGIDKRPKNLYLIGDIVLFHHMEHSYGHNYKKYIRNFNSIMKLDKSAKNLDSIVGFTYCSCKNEKADLSPLLGKWKVKFISRISIEDKYYQGAFSDSTFFNDKVPNTIEIKKDSMKIDQFKGFIRHPPTSLDLPDSDHYMRYGFLESDYRTMPADSLKYYFYPEFINESKKIRKKKTSLTTYHFNLDLRTYPLFFRLRNKTIYMVVNNRLYQLSRM